MDKRKKHKRIFQKIDILLIALVLLIGVAVLLFAAGAILTVLAA